MWTGNSSSVSILYRSFLLHPLPVQASHSLYSILSKTTYFHHILIYLPSNLFIYLFFALIYTHLLNSLFFFVSLHTSFSNNINFIFHSTAVLTTSFHHTVFGSLHQPSLNHIPFLHYQPLPVSPAPHLLIRVFTPFYSLPYPSIY